MTIENNTQKDICWTCHSGHSINSKNVYVLQSADGIWTVALYCEKCNRHNIIDLILESQINEEILPEFQNIIDYLHAAYIVEQILDYPVYDPEFVHKFKYMLINKILDYCFYNAVL